MRMQRVAHRGQSRTRSSFLSYPHQSNYQPATKPPEDGRGLQSQERRRSTRGNEPTNTLHRRQGRYRTGHTTTPDVSQREARRATHGRFEEY